MVTLTMNNNGMYYKYTVEEETKKRVYRMYKTRPTLNRIKSSNTDQINIAVRWTVFEWMDHDNNMPCWIQIYVTTHKV